MLVIKLVETIMAGWIVILVLKLEVVTVKELNYKFDIKLVLGMSSLSKR